MPIAILNRFLALGSSHAQGDPKPQPTLHTHTRILGDQSMSINNQLQYTFSAIRSKQLPQVETLRRIVSVNGQR